MLVKQTWEIHFLIVHDSYLGDSQEKVDIDAQWFQVCEDWSGVFALCVTVCMG